MEEEEVEVKPLRAPKGPTTPGREDDGAAWLGKKVASIAEGAFRLRFTRGDCGFAGVMEVVVVEVVEEVVVR